MRISDWSSDVCSSDLSASATAHPPGSWRPPGWRARAAPRRDRSADDRRRRAASRPAPPEQVAKEPLHEAPGEADDRNRFGGRRLGGGLPTAVAGLGADDPRTQRSEEHTSELQSLMRN